MLEQVIAILKKYQVQNSAQITQNQIVQIQKSPGSHEVSQNVSAYFEGNIGFDVPKEKFNAINADIAANEAIQGEFSQELSVGASFADYGDIKNVLNEETTRLTHKAGEVLLVDVWATWCGPCQKPMQHNQEMLQKNETSWGDRVRIVGVSVDDSKEVIKKRIETKKWDKVVHLTLEGWNGEHKLIQDFSIQGIPFVCLVDKFGKINYKGHPMQINLEQRINELLKASSEVKSEVAVEPTKKQLSQQKLKDLKNLISPEQLKLRLKEVSLLNVVVQYVKKYSKGQIKYESEVKFNCFDDQSSQIQIILKELSNFEGVKASLTTEKAIKIPTGTHCWECSSALTYPHYWLKWEEGDKFGCIKCVEAPSKIQGHHYNYEKNSILLLAPWKSVAEKGIGKNIQPANISQVTSPHGFSCNGCGGSSKAIGEARYICMGCRGGLPGNRGWVDCCQDCLTNLKVKDATVLANLSNDGHTQDHPFIRILYNVNGYYEF